MIEPQGWLTEVAIMNILPTHYERRKRIVLLKMMIFYWLYHLGQGKPHGFVVFYVGLFIKGSLMPEGIVFLIDPK